MKGWDIGKATPHDIPPIAKNGYFSFEAELVQQTDADSGLVTDFKVCNTTTFSMFAAMF